MLDRKSVNILFSFGYGGDPGTETRAYRTGTGRCLRGSTWELRGGYVLRRKSCVLDRKKGGCGMGLIVKKAFWREVDRKYAWQGV